MIITRKGVETVVEGVQPELNTLAPDFTLYDGDGNTITLDTFKGKPVLISVFPDINTSVCDTQTRKFYELAKTIPNVEVVNVSNNDPQVLKDWCVTNGLDIKMLADTDKDFATKYGLWMPEFEVLARSIFVIDKDGTLVYYEIVPDMASEPNYDKALEVCKEL